MINYFFKHLVVTFVLSLSLCISAFAQSDYYKILSITRSYSSSGRNGSTQSKYTMDSVTIVRTVVTRDNTGKITESRSASSTVDPAYWQELNKYLDLDYFFSQADKSGDPNYYNRGNEYIEIITPYRKHRVSFDSSSFGMKSFAERLPK